MNNLSNQFKTKLACLIMLVMGLNMSAQCPTIPTSPVIICDADGFTFSNLNDSATEVGTNGISWYDSATGGSLQPANSLVSEGTYFADDNSGVCGTRNPITVNFTIPPTNANLSYVKCTGDNKIGQDYFNEIVNPATLPGLTATIYSDEALTTPLNLTVLLPNGGTNLYIVFSDGTCFSQIEIGSIGIFPSPADPTPPTPQQFCSDTNPTVGNLDTGTTIGSNWYLDAAASGSPLASSLPLVNGIYYVRAETFFCDSNPVAVTVEINDPSDAGISGTLDYCDNAVPTTDFNLFDSLTGTPETTGTWTGPLTTSGAHLGTVNITGQTAGVLTFTYTVAGINACPDATSTVIITIYETFSSGTANMPAVFCEADATSNFDLFSLLDNEDAGGQWTEGTTSAGTITNSPLDLTVLIPGIYNYTYTQNVLPNPCPEEFTTVVIEILADPNAGVAINAMFCLNDLAANSPYDLFDALDGTQDNNGGVWTDASSTTVTNPIDITGLTIAGSPYTFTYTINNTSCDDTEDITITVLPAPESGTVSADSPAEFCLGEAPTGFDLFSLLDGEDQTGTWFIGTDNTGTAIANPTDLSVLIPNTYNFTFDVDNIGTCDDELVTVQVIINDLPNTGVANSPAPFCENDPALNNTAFDLFTILTGEDAGGSWNDDDGSGALSGNTLDLSALPIGTFNYTYSITDTTTTCTNSTTVTIIIEDAPNAGTALPFTPICESDAAANSPFDLFTLLGDNPDTNGTWTDALSAIVTNPIDLVALGNGSFDYTYTVLDIGTCSDAPETVTIIINELPNTGIATPLIVCETTTVTNLNLFDQLAGETTGGTWNDDTPSNELTGSIVDLSALAVGVYSFTYTLTDTNTCSNNSTVLVTIEEAPEAGIPTNFDICLIDVTPTSTLDLFNQLDGSQDAGGTWSSINAAGSLTGSTIDLTSLTSNTTFNFTYTVTGLGSCTDDTAIVDVIINETIAPTVVDITQDFCDAATVANLTATGNSIQWYDDATLGTALASTTVLVDGETYYASQVDATSTCESSLRTEVTVTIFLSPNAGVGQNQTLCNNVTFDLNNALTGEDATGAWNDDDGSGALTGTVLDTNGLPVGDYDFTYTVIANAPCFNDTETITITIEEPVTAGIDGAFSICSDDMTVISLLDQLSGEAIGGSWTLNGTPVSDTFIANSGNPLTDSQSGTYIYTIVSACNFDTSEVVVTVVPAPNAGTDNTIPSYCVANGTVDLLTQLGGTPDTNGTWSPLLTSGTNIFDPIQDGTGVYTYTVLASPPFCTTNASATLNITVNNIAAPVTTTNNVTLCVVDNPTVSNLNTFVTGTNIQWYADATSTTVLNLTDVLIDGEDYFATQTSTTTSCQSSVRTIINVTIGDAPTPTLVFGGNSFCINDDPTIATLTSNIVELNSTSTNVVWYDTITNGIAYSATEELIANETYYAVLIDPITLCESSVRLAVVIDLSACGDITIPDGFSPNADGVNDTFTVENLGFLFPNYEIEFYNRYGSIIFKTKAGQADFAGQSNQSRLINKDDLPVGVYYYILNFNDGTTKTKQGSFYLNR